ncbi:hypothetical protein [Micromonospora sp. NPDC048839]|uniref:hypothetical protein n=1 Tax=Micromonospora sp. NPDC048839 TaxID=3155641 RepID=UPI0033FFE2BD
MSFHAGEFAREMENVNRALAEAAVLLAGLDQADSARELRPPGYSPLRTLVEQAEKSAARVTEFLREQSRA